LAFLIIGHAFLGVEGQFGGGYNNRPAPNCPLFTCPAGQKPVGKLDYQTWSYGCKDSGMNFLSMNNLDPNNPYGGQKQKSVDRCCVERDICKQTCGMTPKACHDSFQKCSSKICKGDQNCELQAMMAEMMSEPSDPEESKSPDYKYDPVAMQCRGYNKGQNASCECVGKEEWQGVTEAKLKAFYAKFNPEKLNKKGEIKDVKDVWKKWKGKEPDMFMALTTKYKDKAVEIRVKPKPDYSKEPPLDASAYEPSGEEIPLDEPPEPAAEEPARRASKPPGGASLDEDDKAYDRKIKELVAKKKKAARDEEYELADEAKEEAAAATRAEVERLKASKAKAIEGEDYAEAKRVKQRLQKVEL